MAEPLELLIDRVATPIGELIVIADRDGKLRTVDWTDHEARMRACSTATTARAATR